MKLTILLRRTKLLFVLVAAGIFAMQLAAAQKKEVVWSADEKPLADQIHGLRGLADDVRAGTTKDLALKIRKLPATENKLRLAVNLAGLSTEGDFGHDTLQVVATTWTRLCASGRCLGRRVRTRAGAPAPHVRRRIHILSSPRWCVTSTSRPR